MIVISLLHISAMDRNGTNNFRSPFLRPNAHLMAASANQGSGSSSKTLKGIIAGKSVIAYLDKITSLV